MSDNPIREMLQRVAAGQIPSMRELDALGLSGDDRRDLEVAVRRVEADQEIDVDALADQLEARLPLVGDDPSPRDLAAGLPAYY